MAVLIAYFALFASWWLVLALALPALIAWQWMSLRLKANDALVTAIAARHELAELVSANLGEQGGTNDADPPPQPDEKPWTIRQDDPIATYIYSVPEGPLGSSEPGT